MSSRCPAAPDPRVSKCRFLHLPRRQDTADPASALPVMVMIPSILDGALRAGRAAALGLFGRLAGAARGLAGAPPPPPAVYAVIRKNEAPGHLRKIWESQRCLRSCSRKRTEAAFPWLIMQGLTHPSGLAGWGPGAGPPSLRSGTGLGALQSCVSL